MFPKTYARLADHLMVDARFMQGGSNIHYLEEKVGKHRKGEAA